MKDDVIRRRQIEVLYQDILAEIGPLLNQVDSLKEQIEKLLRAGQALPHDLQAVLNESSTRFNAETAMEINHLLLTLGGIAESTKRNAAFVEKASRKMLLLNILAGAIAGVLGGILAGMALGQHLLSG